MDPYKTSLILKPFNQRSINDSQTNFQLMFETYSINTIDDYV